MIFVNKFIYIDLCVLLIYIFTLYVFKYIDLDTEKYAPIIYLFKSFDLDINIYIPIWLLN